MVDLSQLRTHLVARHHHRPQEVTTIDHALRELGEALGRLAALGHLYHLEPGPMPQMAEFPRLVFHVDSAPNGRVVNSQWDLYDLGGEASGWYSTLDEAQHADGVKTQFAGRGGVGTRSLPMVIPQPETKDDEMALVSKRKLIETWKRTHSNGSDRNDGPEGPDSPTA